MKHSPGDLLTAAFGDEHLALATWYAAVLAQRPALHDFTAVNASKIRKKARRAVTPDDGRDLRCELAVAALLAARNSPLSYEPTASENRRGPDFLLQHKGHTAVYVEVSRLRPSLSPERDPRDRLASVICGKLRQLMPGAANLIALVNDDAPLDELDVASALAGLRRRAEARDNPFFAFRGLDGARELHRRLPLLSGVLVATPMRGSQVLHLPPGARHQLPPDLARAIVRDDLATLVGPPPPSDDAKTEG